jgi:hypothetical protein
MILFKLKNGRCFGIGMEVMGHGVKAAIAVGPVECSELSVHKWTGKF